MTGSLSRAFHLWLPRRTADKFSRSPVVAHLIINIDSINIDFSPVT